MHRFPVPSKEITQVGYQEDSETLEIQFAKGGSINFSMCLQQCSMNL